MARALIIGDVNNDFCPGGAWAVGEGDAVVEWADALARSGAFALVVAERSYSQGFLSSTIVLSTNRTDTSTV